MAEICGEAEGFDSEYYVDVAVSALNSDNNRMQTLDDEDL